LFNWRGSSVHGPVNESSIGSVSVLTQISSGDVVSNSEGTVAVIVSNARQFISEGESPVVKVVVTSVTSVSKMVVSCKRGKNAVWGRDSVRCDFSPDQTRGSAAVGHVVRGSLYSIGIHANPSGFDVVRLCLVKSAVVHVGGEHSNIDPWGRGPVWVIISLFGTLITESLSIVVLSGESCVSTVQISVVNPESQISASGGASLVVGIVLVHSIGQFSSSEGNGTIGVVGDGIGGNSISDQKGGIRVGVGANILENNIAYQFSVNSTTMLCSPLNGEVRALIKAHGRSVAVATLSIILRVIQTIGIISVGIGFIETVIASPGVLHIHISIGDSQKKEHGSKELHFH
jgi:hypothetical protein